MLERLSIRDLALVERAEVPFAAGLNVVTGETGAGKTLLVQAVSLLVGERADAEAVREGARSALVEGEFRLEGQSAARVGALLAEWGLDFDGETLIVRREVQAGGKSRAAVNQAAVTQGSLKRLGDALADLHGQHEHQSLLRPDAARDVLDGLAGLGQERARFAELLGTAREAGNDLVRLERSLADFGERRDRMLEAARELDEVKLREGEEEELKLEAARLAHADRLRVLVGQVLERLSEGEGAALGSLASAAHALEQAAALDPSLEQTLPALEEARIAAGDTARALAGYAARLEADPEALEAVEARREWIARLVRKHRRGVPELLRWRDQLARELAEGEDATGTLERARARAEKARTTCLAAARALSRKRQAAAREWSGKLTRELPPLGFGRAALEFVVGPAAGEAPELTAAGLDEVSLLFAANPGEPARPLQRIASGGEISRVMLALKTALESNDSVDLLLFDEVDSGIGGTVAQAVGERLRKLSRHRQIVCVTHLPMIAALADHHLRVTKHAAGGRTVARVEPVGGEQRIEELARMLAGERVTETTRRQARELLGEPTTRSAAR